MSFLYIFALFCLMMGSCVQTGRAAKCDEAVVWSCCARGIMSSSSLAPLRDPRHHEAEAVGCIRDPVQVTSESSVLERFSDFTQHLSLLRPHWTRTME